MRCARRRRPAPAAEPRRSPDAADLSAHLGTRGAEDQRTHRTADQRAVPATLTCVERSYSPDRVDAGDQQIAPAGRSPAWRFRLIRQHKGIRRDDHLVVTEMGGVVVDLTGAGLAVDHGLQLHRAPDGLGPVDLGTSIDSTSRAPGRRRRTPSAIRAGLDHRDRLIGLQRDDDEASLSFVDTAHAARGSGRHQLAGGELAAGRRLEDDPVRKLCPASTLGSIPVGVRSR